MTDFYKNFAIYYQELAEKRNHFELQTQVIQDLFKVLKIDHSKRILDAACGTGTVGNLLFNDGFKNIFLTDGSENMVDFAKKSIDSNIPIIQCKWENLNEYFDINGSFDAVVLFGNSFAHASSTLHKQLFKNIFDGLNDNGCFIFDIRIWDKNEEGNYFESKKPTNTAIELEDILIDGLKLHVDQVIKYNYEEKRQIVSYIINDLKTQKTLETINLEYSLFSFEDILPVLKSVGFKLENIQTKNIANWSYQAICCKK